MKIFCLDSDEAEHLETEKKTARSKGEAKRKKFQAQDSVLNESLNASQAGFDASKLNGGGKQKTLWKTKLE